MDMEITASKVEVKLKRADTIPPIRHLSRFKCLNAILVHPAQVPEMLTHLFLEHNVTLAFRQNYKKAKTKR